MACNTWDRVVPGYQWAGEALAWLSGCGERLGHLLGGWKDDDDLSPLQTADPELVALLEYVGALLAAKS